MLKKKKLNMKLTRQHLSDTLDYQTHLQFKMSVFLEQQKQIKIKKKTHKTNLEK